MKLVVSNYQGLEVSFSEEGWFNATVAAKACGKHCGNWLRQKHIKAYLEAKAKHLGLIDSSALVRKTPQGLVWLHSSVKIRFACWLDARFAVWCDHEAGSEEQSNPKQFKGMQAVMAASGVGFEIQPFDMEGCDL